jgi:RNA polymerase sigma factor (sigma-70 family)
MESEVESLTNRERDVASLIAEGLSNREIAKRLGISQATVRHHLTSIYAKLQTPNRQKLALRMLSTMR